MKRLRAELETAQDTLNDTKRDHAIDMQEQGYDSMSDQLNQILEDTEYEINHNADKQQEVIQSMLSNVVNMYASAYGQINSIIANTGWVGSSDFNQNQQQLSSSNGAKTQTNNALKNQSSVKPSGSATSTVTSPISNNSSYNSKVESEIMKAPNTTNRLVAELKLSPTSVSLEEGKSTKITASMRPNDAKNKTLSWKSSNQSVATVSGGTINAVGPGSCQITVSTTDGSGLSASVGVTVTEKPKPVQQEPTLSTSAPVSNGGDGVPKVGDKATFTGSYYYSSWGTSPSGSLYSGVENGVVINSYSNKKYGGTARITGDYDVSISSADGKYQLGWVKLRQLSGYSAGTKGVTNNAEIARIDELGKELRIKRGGDIYEMFHYGDAVLPKPMTDNLFTLADHTNEIMETIDGVDRSGNGDVTVNNNYESLLTVNGDIDKDTFPGVKKMCEEAYQYTSKKMKKDARYMGITRTL